VPFGGLFGEFFGSGGDSNWDTYENGIRQWVIAATGISPTKVIRAEQDGPRPVAPFVEVRVGDALALGAADGLEQYFDALADPGQEVTQVVRAQREVSVTLRAFTDAAVGGSSARALLARVQASLGFAEVRDVLHDAGITCFDRGSVQHLPGVLDTRWEGRATLTVRVYVEDTAILTTGYIDTVQLVDASVDPPVVYTETLP
jgi:hypothetical protein